MEGTAHGAIAGDSIDGFVVGAAAGRVFGNLWVVVSDGKISIGITPILRGTR